MERKYSSTHSYQHFSDFLADKNRLNTILQRLFPDFSLEPVYYQCGPCHEPIWKCTLYRMLR